MHNKSFNATWSQRVRVYVSLCVWKRAKAVFKGGLLALISVDMSGGGVHQSTALLVLDNPTETLNLSSASGCLYQSPVTYPSDPIIDSNPVCLSVYSEVASWLIGNRYKHTVSQSHSQTETSPLKWVYPALLVHSTQTLWLRMSRKYTFALRGTSSHWTSESKVK